MNARTTKIDVFGKRQGRVISTTVWCLFHNTTTTTASTISIQRTWWTSTAPQSLTAQPGGFSGLAVDPRLAALKESRASGLSNHSG
ncbi:MAG: hypothetical protein ABF370_15965, partial [Verrucomicrobiales bacterium]